MEWDGMGVCPAPDRHAAPPTSSVSAHFAGCPALDAEPRKPPLTQSETGVVVKFPHTCTEGSLY